jgi:hypothetical protein
MTESESAFIGGSIFSHLIPAAEDLNAWVDEATRRMQHVGERGCRFTRFAIE